MDSGGDENLRKLQLEDGLRHLGLSLRRTSQPRKGKWRPENATEVTNEWSFAAQEAYIRGRKRLYHVLETMTRMHWLHSHTGGVFEREVDKKVQKFLWANAVDQVQDMPLWRHLPDPLPWLPQYATSGEALDAAVAAAMPRRSRSS